MRSGTLALITMAIGLVSSPALWLPSAEAQQSQPPSQSRQHQQPPMDAAERMLEDQIYVRLAEHAWVGGDFKAAVNQGVVTLSGTVPSDQTKQKILRIARRTAGVSEVRDQLRINPSVGAQRSGAAPVADSELSKQVAEQIASTISGAKAGADWWSSNWRVEGIDQTWTMTVDADNGAVTLDGDVPDKSVIRKSVEAALQVHGVRSVRSDIDVESIYARSGRYYPDYYGSWGSPYEYGYPYAYRRDGMPRNVRDFGGLHTMTGEVTKLDHQKGTVTLKTDTGTFDLQLPPASLQNVTPGAKIAVEMGVKNLDGAAASPRTDGSASQGASPTKK
jgi:osmotically-inducible protein OsmY